MVPGVHTQQVRHSRALTRNGVGCPPLSVSALVAVTPRDSAPPGGGSCGQQASCSHRQRTDVRVKASSQLAGTLATASTVTTATSTSTSTAATQALRPRRFSAPVIARLIRSTSSLQELADVVQQQSPYFDPSHVGIAFLHLALLARQQEGAQPVSPWAQAPAATATAATPAAALAATSGGVGSATSGGSPSRSPSVSTDIPAARGSAGEEESQLLQLSPLLDDDGAGVEPLLLSPIFDDGHDHEGGLTGSAGSLNGSAGNGATNGSGSYAGSGAGLSAETGRTPVDRDVSGGDGEEGGRAGHSDWPSSAPASSSLLPNSLLDAATAAILPQPRDPDPEAPPRVVASQRGPRPGPGPDQEDASASGIAGRGGSEGTEDRRQTEAPPASTPATTAGGAAAAALAATVPTSATAAASTSAASSMPGTSITTTSTITAATSASPAAAPSNLSVSVSVSAVLRSLLPLVFQQLDSLRGSDLAAVLSSLAVVRYGEKVVVEQLLQAQAVRLYDCTPQDISNSMCSAALLEVPLSPDLRQSFFLATRNRVKRFQPRDLALSMWAYGAGGTSVNEAAVQLLLDASRPKLSAFSPLHLAKMAQGLAALRYRPSPEWMSLFCQAVRPALRRMSSRELCALLLALTGLQIGLDDTTRATLLVHTLTVLPSLAPSELALSIWALGRLTAAGLPALIDLDTSGRVLDVTLATLGSFSAPELQQLLEGLTRLALQPPLEWMQAYVQALQPKLKELDAQQLAGVLGSLAAQQYRPMPEMQEVVLAVTQANMQQLLADTTCAASLVTALRRLNIEPPPSWVEALLAASRSALKNRCTDLHLANLAGSLAAWGVRPDGRWAARLMWRSMALMVENRMSPRALVALLQAMTSLGLKPNEVWTKLCLSTAVLRASQPSFEPQHFCTLMASLHALEIQPPQEWLLRMLLSTYRCWDRFNMAHWSSLLPALVLLDARPHRAWLRRLEAATAPRLADCSALQLLTLLVALHQLHRQQPQGPEAALLAAAFQDGQGGAGLQSRQQLQQQQGEEGTLLLTEGPEGWGPGDALAAPQRLAPVAEAVADGATTPPPSPSAAAAAAAGAPLDASRAAAADVAEVSLAAGSGGGSVAASRPAPEWMSSWWAASSRLLTRVRYAPSELALTAGWLASLELEPPPEWLQACGEVAERYSKVMDEEECQQLARAMLPLVQRRPVP